MDLVHQLKGRIIVYVLECEPLSDGRPIRYVGTTNNCERRTAEHMGIANGKVLCDSDVVFEAIDIRVGLFTPEGD